LLALFLPGGVPPLSIRAHGSSLPLVRIEPPAHLRAGGCWLAFLHHGRGKKNETARTA